MSDLINTMVATQLKKARTDKGWSLDLASQHCGVSKAMLGQIERGESSPTIARLWKIATGFALPLSDFLGTQNEQESMIEASHQEKNMSIHTVFEYDQKTKMEMFELTFSVGHEQNSEAHQSGVIEHVVVISGCMQYAVNGDWKTLSTGDKTKFSADQAHAYRNIGQSPLRFFNIIYYP